MAFIDVRSDDPSAIAYKFRKKRSVHTLEMIEQCFSESGRCRIIDIGGEAWYWDFFFDMAFLRSRNVTIKLINTEPVAIADDIFVSETCDACDLRHIPSHSFDIAHSNSVIEHVGDWERMVAFASELRRMAPRYFVQTPNFWFPIEPHFGGAPFLHWLPEPTRVALMLRFELGPIKVKDVGQATNKTQSARLLNSKQFRFLFADAEIRRERVLGITKSLMAIRNRPGTGVTSSDDGVGKMLVPHNGA